MSSRQYRRDLRRIPAKYRQPVDQYLRDGILPEDKTIQALLIADFEYVLAEHAPDIAETYALLKTHLPRFAHGSPLAVARWQFMMETINSHEAPTATKEDHASC